MPSLDDVYLERNMLVGALAMLVHATGGLERAGRGKDPSEPPEWQNVIFVDLPTGQISFHVHEREMHLYRNLPEYPFRWDGHSSEEKWRRVRALLTPEDVDPDLRVEGQAE